MEHVVFWWSKNVVQTSLRLKSWSCTNKEMDVLLYLDGCLLSEQRPSHAPLGNNASAHLWDVRDLREKGATRVKGQGGSMCAWRSMVYNLLFGMQMSCNSMATAPRGLSLCVCVCLGDGGYPRTGVRGHVLHWGQTGAEREGWGSVEK